MRPLLVGLMAGVALPASELARLAGVAPSTATSHLRRLTEAGLVALDRPDTARGQEGLASLGVTWNAC